MSPITRRIRRAPQIAPADNPQNVLLLPGFLATPVTMAYLGRQMQRAGHNVAHWALGANLGATRERLSVIEQQLRELHQESGVRFTLVGWSLGGLFAREVAKLRPEAVRKVITLGSPFSGDPRANNAWRLYQFVAGHPVDAPPIDTDVSVKPPVETVAFWSPRDGVIAPRSACGKPGERDRSIALRCTHMGFSYSPEAIEGILSELQRD